MRRWSKVASHILLTLLVLGLLAGAGSKSNPQHLPTSKTLSSAIPGSPQRTNNLPETIALSPDGHYAVLLNAGYGSVESKICQSITILDLETDRVTDFPDARLTDQDHQTYFLGLAFGADGRHLYASMSSITDPTGKKPGNTGNGIAVYSFAEGRVTPERFIKIGPQQVPSRSYIARGLFKLGRGQAIPFPAGMAVVTRGGKEQILVANNLSDNAVLLDVASGAEVAHFDLTTYKTVPSSFPYTVVASRDGRRAWCSLWNGSQVAELDLEKGTVVRRIPLLAPPVAIAAGSHPTAMALSPDDKLLYVGLTNEDAVAVISTENGQPVRYLSTAPEDMRYWGAQPINLALSPNGNRLFVADMSLNAVAVLDVSKIRANEPSAAPSSVRQAPMGFVPTEWLPTAVAIRGDDLLIATGKGLGTGPNAERNAPVNAKRRHDFPYIPTLLRGSIARLNIAQVEHELPELTQVAKEQALLLTKPESLPFPSGKSPLRHVIYIVKENRTYDQILGDLKVGDGDSSLTLYGEDITPNEHKLALQFGVLDNFYDSGEVSGDGHMWSTAAITSDYDELLWPIGYRGRERLYDFEGTVGEEYPLEHGEPDVNDPQSGYLWGNVARHGLTYRHYGEWVATEWCEKPKKNQASPKQGSPSPPGGECERSAVQPGEPLPLLTGQTQPVPNPFRWPVPVLRRNVATKPELRDHFDPRFADFKEDYPDQLRAEEFLGEFAGFVKARKEGKKDAELPNYILLRLPNDHTAGKHPGFPTPSASVADNDLAIGRVVDAVSHSTYWDDTAIFIVEDDAQDGADHVDAHRSIAFVISKYSPGSAAHPHVEHGFFTTVSLVRTMEAVLGLPPMNQNDGYAPVMASMFAGSGNQAPYTADYRNRDNRLIYTANEKKSQGAAESMKLDFSHADAADSGILNAILWRDRKGNVPMPIAKFSGAGVK